MNILFLTLAPINSLDQKGIYTDLLRCFIKNGHSLTIASPIERRYKKNGYIVHENQATILKIKTFNIQKTNFIEKGVSTLSIEYLFLRAIKKNTTHHKFDIILYSTPPITFTKVIKYIKKRDNAFSYLLLKDIFPQNAVDLNFLKKRSLIYKYFRKKEIELYKVSDKIGCMSPENRNYILKSNPTINPSKIEVNPNSIELRHISNSEIISREKLHIDSNQVLLVYGGNLGKPQAINFVIEILKHNLNNPNSFWVIAGSGTEFPKLEKWMNDNNPKNIKLIKQLSPDEFDSLLKISDIGLVFLDRRFTIPNFPSRILSYMENSLPIIFATDRNTDVGKIAENNQFGFYCEEGKLPDFQKTLENLIENPEIRKKYGKNGYQYLKENYQVDISYSKIIKSHSQNVLTSN